MVGLFSKKMGITEGNFGKKQMITFALVNVAANVIAWLGVAPTLDILMYAEPANKVFAQGGLAAVANSVTAVVVGILLAVAYAKTIAKKGSLDQE